MDKSDARLVNEWFQLAMVWVQDKDVDDWKENMAFG